MRRREVETETRKKCQEMEMKCRGMTDGSRGSSAAGRQRTEEGKII
jgi:hypothetical protein